VEAVVRGGAANLGRGTGGGSQTAAAPLFPIEEGRRRLPRVVLQKGKSAGLFVNINFPTILGIK
jgi:hypothetical protein